MSYKLIIFLSLFFLKNNILCFQGNIDQQRQANFAFNDLSSDDENAPTCAICFENLHSEPVTQVICDSIVPHVFHHRCITQWFNKFWDRPVCPMDMTPARLPNVNYISKDDLYIHGLAMGSSILPLAILLYKILQTKRFGQFFTNSLLSDVIDFSASLSIVSAAAFFTYLFFYLKRSNIRYNLIDLSLFSFGEISGFVFSLIALSHIFRLSGLEV